MSNRKNDLLDLHPVAVVGSLLGARPLEARAAQKDAEPETCERRESLLRRLAATFRSRREAEARTQTGGA
jgi:hypothetical protein